MAVTGTGLRGSLIAGGDHAVGEALQEVLAFFISGGS